MQSVIRYFYPSLNAQEARKFGLLSMTFFFIIGAYWALRGLKDVILLKIAFPASMGWAVGQGRLFLPIAKTISPFIVIALVLIYSRLVDLFKKHQLIYIITSFYTAIFSTITVLLLLRHFWGDAILGKYVLAGLGWTAYIAIESLGSILVALFWAFTISITTSESAKAGFPCIVAGAQVGAIMGALLNVFSESIGGIAYVFMLSTVALFSAIPMIKFFMATTPADQLVGNKAAAEKAVQKEKPGFLESFFGGLRLLLTKPYLIGVLIVSTFYEVAGVIIDYQMKANADINPEWSGEIGFAKFVGLFGVCTNTLSFVIALLGTGYLLKQYGIRFCLLVYPSAFAIVLTGYYFFYQYYPHTPSQVLWASFVVMVVVKGFSYAVNNPTKEMMYIPTSKDVKFKAKSWTDMFGGRTAKTLGSQLTNALKHDIGALMVYGTLFGFGIIAIWFVAALFVGRKNQALINSNTIIE